MRRQPGAELDARLIVAGEKLVEIDERCLPRCAGPLTLVAELRKTAKPKVQRAALQEMQVMRQTRPVAQSQAGDHLVRLFQKQNDHFGEIILADFGSQFSDTRPVDHGLPPSDHPGPVLQPQVNSRLRQTASGLPRRVAF